MAARETAYAESLAESSTTSTTFQDKVSQAFTGSANTDYVVLYTAQIKSTNDAEVKGLKGATDGPVGFYDRRDTTDYEPWVWMDFIETGASPSSVTYKIQYRAISTETVDIKNARIYIIELTADDKFAQQDSDQSTASSSYVDALSLAFTPGSIGDYYVCGCGVRKPGVSGADHWIRLNHDTGSVEHGESERNVSANMEDIQFFGRRFASLAASSQTFSVEQRTQDADNAVCNKLRLLALRLDGFPAHYYADSLGESTTTSTTYQDKTSLVATLADGREHIIIGNHYWHTSSNTQSFLGRWVDDGAAIQDEHTIEPRGSSTNQGGMVGFFDQFTGDGASHTWKDQFHIETSATARIRDSSILILQLNAGGATEVSRTTSLDGALERQNTLAASANAAIQVAALTRTTDLTAALEAIGSRTVALDAALQQLVAAETSLDAALKQLNKALVADLGAAVRKFGLTRATTVEAALLADGLVEALSLDALIQVLGLSRTTAADAAIRKPDVTRAAAADAALLASGLAENLSLDALVQSLGLSRAANLDAALQSSGLAQAASLDSVVRSAKAFQVALGGAIRTAEALGVSLDASVIAAADKSLTVRLDAALKAARDLNLALSAAVQMPGLSLVVSLDTALALNKQLTASLGAVLASVRHLSASLDAKILGSVILSTLFDAIVQGPARPETRPHRTQTAGAQPDWVIGPGGRTILIPANTRRH